MDRDRTSPGRLEARVRQLLREGDPDAAATCVVEALGQGVLGYLFTTLPEDDAYDVFSAFQEDVWRGLPGFRWECSLRSWAYRIARNAAARFARDGYRCRRQPLRSGLASGLATPAASTSGLCDRRQQLAILRDELPPEDRTLLALRVAGEMEWDEVCTVLAAEGEEISPAALRKRFERLKNKLARLARERGLIA